jgi:hypothetical protein
VTNHRLTILSLEVLGSKAKSWLEGDLHPFNALERTPINIRRPTCVVHTTNTFFNKVISVDERMPVPRLIKGYVILWHEHGPVVHFEVTRRRKPTIYDNLSLYGQYLPLQHST